MNVIASSHVNDRMAPSAPSIKVYSADINRHNWHALVVGFGFKKVVSGRFYKHS